MNHIRPTVVCGKEKAETETAFSKVTRLCKKNYVEQTCKMCTHANKWKGKTDTKQYIITA